MPDRYGPDKVIGIIVISLFGCCLMCSLVGQAAGTALGQTGAAAQQGGLTGSNMALNIAGLLLTAATVAGGIGVFLSIRWGFIICAIVAALQLVMTLVSITMSVGMIQEQFQADTDMPEGAAQFAMYAVYGWVGAIIVLYGALMLYSVVRLNGKLGPRPK
ncbi:MAG: hypothetical protein IH851_04400 [Armatimonadetes bacterium]|nr:hypothetical protein [Armatimonadota bacterium]